MLPETSWNSPFITIEKNRTSQNFEKFVHFSELWNSKVPEIISADSANSWETLFESQNQSLQAYLKVESANTTLFNQLQNSCWQYGKQIAEKDWAVITVAEPHDAYLALSYLRIGNPLHSDCFLLERKTDTLCTFYWLSSPIQHLQLCILYHELFRGYFYHLSRNIRVEIHPSILPQAHEKQKTWKINLLWID